MKVVTVTVYGSGNSCPPQHMGVSWENCPRDMDVCLSRLMRRAAKDSQDGGRVMVQIRPRCRPDSAEMTAASTLSKTKHKVDEDQSTIKVDGQDQVLLWDDGDQSTINVDKFGW